MNQQAKKLVGICLVKKNYNGELPQSKEDFISVLFDYTTCDSISKKDALGSKLTTAYSKRMLRDACRCGSAKPPITGVRLIGVTARDNRDRARVVNTSPVEEIYHQNGTFLFRTYSGSIYTLA